MTRIRQSMLVAAMVLLGSLARHPIVPAEQGTTLRNMLNHAHEWDVMMTRGEIFPELAPQAVRKITAAVLLLSGENSYHFLGLIDEELERLLPHNRRIILHGATHRMWFEQPEICRKTVLDFWREQQD